MSNWPLHIVSHRLAENELKIIQPPAENREFIWYFQ